MNAGTDDSRRAALAALAWLVEAGANESIGVEPVDRLAARPAPPQAPQAPQRAPATRPPAGAPQARPPAAARAPEPPPVWQARSRELRAQDAAVAEAEQAARAAESLEALYRAIRDFDGCDLKLTAKNTVVYRGTPGAEIVLIGEAPGRDEDLQGQPFVGAGGQLLDAMLRAAGFDPERDVYVTNCLFWRPPGNRTPSEQELQICMPFVERHIELLAPRYLMFLGGTPAKTLLAEARGITRLRGRWFRYQHAQLPAPLPAMPVFHPAYLLRQPAQKRLAWRDLLAFRAAVEAGGDPLATQRDAT